MTTDSVTRRSPVSALDEAQRYERFDRLKTHAHRGTRCGSTKWASRRRHPIGHPGRVGERSGGSLYAGIRGTILFLLLFCVSRGYDGLRDLDAVAPAIVEYYSRLAAGVIPSPRPGSALARLVNDSSSRPLSRSCSSDRGYSARSPTHPGSESLHRIPYNTTERSATSRWRGHSHVRRRSRLFELGRRRMPPLFAEEGGQHPIGSRICTRSRSLSRPPLCCVMSGRPSLR